MKHADIVIDRILYFDGTPNMQRLYPVRVGETVAEQLQLDVELEYAAVERLNNGIAVCVAKGDNGTRELLADILVSEEDHIDWLETQQETIRQIGLERVPRPAAARVARTLSRVSLPSAMMTRGQHFRSKGALPWRSASPSTVCSTRTTWSRARCWSTTSGNRSA